MPYFEKPRMNMPVENPGELHLPLVVLLDTSGSMSGSMAELNEGVRILGETLKQDPVASGRVELTIITYDDTVKVEVPFGPVSQFEAPVLSCGGMTSMHAAVGAALQEIENRKQEYKSQGISYYRPWIFMLSDGYPNDADNGEFNQLIAAQNNKKTTFFGFGIGSAVDKNLLKSLNKDGMCLSASATDFKSCFQWLSASVSMASSSNPGDKLNLPNPGAYGQISVES